ncbi:MAG: DUF992 domain-containing protein [Xanthobacteraceae bacterium]|jgi:hypothetical protein
MTRFAMTFALGLTALAATTAAAAAQSRVRTGILECRGAPTTSFGVGSVQHLACTFQSDDGGRYLYDGTASRAGLDVGFTERSMLAWAVFAPTGVIGPGDLAGTYGGITAGAAVGVGGNANALVGGSANSFALQPLSLEGQTGLNVAVGALELDLRYAGDGHRHQRGRRAHAHHHRRHASARG